MDDFRNNHNRTNGVFNLWTWIILLSILLGPSKPIAYICGVMGTLFLIIRLSKDRDIATQPMAAAIILATVHILSLALSNEPKLVNATFSLILYSWIPFVWFIFRIQNDNFLGLESLYNVVRAVLFIEVAAGATQWIYAAIARGYTDLDLGDFVEGTIAPGLNADRTFANPMFSSMCVLLLLMLLSRVRLSSVDRLLCALAGIMILLASVMHVTIMGMVAMGFATLIVYSHTRNFFRVILLRAVILGIALGMLTIVMPKNLGLVAEYAQLDERDNYKYRGLKEAINSESLPFGHGLGGFGSRSYKIATGEFQGLQADLVGPQNATIAERARLWPLWMEALSRNKRGASNHPYSSITSLIGETGIVGICIVLLLPTILINRYLRKLRAEGPSANQRADFAAWSAFLFCYFLGFFELYWDLPQLMLLAGVTARYSWAQR